ncbi:MAG: hypothetical protein A2487_16055 [Candidatus Raymondbacteria bacterium RifOxyC12_full_50_8]|uniref:Uncharacterized protein n=1 Tax=Candidatus Raymondbacteria bacterium RIFOXYD12_FULL_49_13 TaxID=1817890 RepID=A0A1F7FF44_UNCRA|nr:MAG: hypothetical protein A2248_10275 [Candidatus Raymondbacteria bacterium RIFOXYA2_FULL_49_16]OGJ99622.1 MAG: hypothetical protein A2487_16055 [Candidatus Raymondbacteria bacterium RifOxyC12_full_50_8]OGK05238.1 MAG: hypothetical protein A2519_10410 [Candidatus Raymondbacteria bacterium RIFOXYD12_FULL_49_13]OGP43025.1 MAG: hypothetical protein A2324_14960 [Candidatus Raymondbacteria bacterium RIFOXYB2_FULL_49_35]
MPEPIMPKGPNPVNTNRSEIRTRDQREEMVRASKQRIEERTQSDLDTAQENKVQRRQEIRQNEVDAAKENRAAVEEKQRMAQAQKQQTTEKDNPNSGNIINVVV